MTLRILAQAAGLLGPLVLLSAPAAAQDETSERLIEALSAPILRFAEIAGLPPEDVFAVAPAATQQGEGWRVELPSWRVPLAEGQLLFGCGPEIWQASVAGDGTIEARTESPLACELRVLG